MLININIKIINYIVYIVFHSKLSTSRRFLCLQHMSVPARHSSGTQQPHVASGRGFGECGSSGDSSKIQSIYHSFIISDEFLLNFVTI